MRLDEDKLKPGIENSTRDGGHPDLTARDYFAARAMQSQMLNHKQMKFWAEEYSVTEMWEFAAANAYRMADAMLKERDKRYVG